MSAAAMIPSFLPLLIVAAMRRAEARIHRQLADAGALTAESAIPLSPGRPLQRGRLQSLVRGGAVGQTASSRYFLDVDGWNRYRRDRRRRALSALSVVVALVGLAAAVFFFAR